MAERPSSEAVTRTDHQGANAQHRSCPLLVSGLPQGEQLSQKPSSQLASAEAGAVAGTCLCSKAQDVQLPTGSPRL